VISKILVSLRILDRDLTLSLTSIGVMILLGKIAFAPTLDWPTAASLLLALASYSHKRQINSKRASTSAVLDAQVAELEKKVAELMTASGLKKLR
jgi:hypothetical protein